MKIRTLVIAVVIICFLTSCNRSVDQDSSRQVTLIASKLLTLPLDTLTPNWASDCQYFDDKAGNELIVYYSPINNTLYQYSVNTKSIVNKIKFEPEGTNGIPQPMAFQVLSKDSIAVATSYTKQLFLTDSKGKIFSKISLVSDSKLLQKWASEPSAKFYIKNGICIFETAPFADPKEPKVYYNTPLGVSLNLYTKQSKINFIYYPKEYKKGGYWTMFHNMQRLTINNKGNVVASFPISENIQEINPVTNQTLEYNAGSKYFEGHTQPLKNGENGRVHFLKEDSYGAIYYDTYRNVYYRFASQRIKDELPEPSGPIIPATFMTTSVIILDSNFNKIGETILPRKKHYYYNSFVGREGLYISNSHPQNKDNTENKVSFTCYTLIDKL